MFKKVWEMATFAGFLVGRESAKHMKNNGTIIFTGATASVRGVLASVLFHQLNLV